MNPGGTGITAQENGNTRSNINQFIG